MDADFTIGGVLVWGLHKRSAGEECGNRVDSRLMLSFPYRQEGVFEASVGGYRRPNLDALMIGEG